MMETVSAPVWEPDEGGALPWIGLITRSSPSRHYPLINHVMIKTFNGGLTILSFGHHHVCSSLSPWCQCSMSFDLSLLLITNVSPSVGNNKFPFDIFAVYGSWTSTRPPMMILMRAVDHLSSRLISDHPHHHLVPGATCSVWVWGTLTPKRIHPRVLAFSFILPLSFQHFLLRRGI